MNMIGPIEGAMRQIGKMLISAHGDHLKIDLKGSRELVTNLDQEADRILTSLVSEHFPGHRVLSEESKSTITKENWKDLPLWIIDPIDGTANFIRGISLFCVAAAFYDHGTAEAAVVYDPSHDEMFAALRGQGARLNGRQIRVSAADELSRAVLATGFPYERTPGRDNTDHITHLVPIVSDLRRSGTGILDMAWVACGRLDGYFEHEIPPWDAAAGAMLVQEAGGKVTNYRGERYDPFQKDLCTSNGAIHEELISVLLKGKSGIHP